MNVDNTNVQMKKGILEYCVLHIISRGEVYTSDLMSELAQARLVVVEGTLYPLLTRLKNAGWLEYKWVESAFGPPRKYYSLTTVGTQMLEQLDQTWLEIRHAVNMIVGDNLAPLAPQQFKNGATPPPIPQEAVPETSNPAEGDTSLEASSDTSQDTSPDSTPDASSDSTSTTSTQA